MDSVEEMMRNDLREILNIPDNFEILFLTGGASFTYSVIYHSLVLAKPEVNNIDYLVTGLWSMKACRDADNFGIANKLVEVEQKLGLQIPDSSVWGSRNNSPYLYYCDNETVNGTEYHQPPQSDSLLIADMTSNFMTKPIDFSKYALVYAGSQKNLGVVGLTTIVVRKDLIPASYAGIPSALNLLTYLKTNPTRPRVPPFSLRSCQIMVRMAKEEGGIAEMQRRSRLKSDLIYKEIDQSGGFYRGISHISNRSCMNVTFRIQGGSSTLKKFLREAGELGMKMLAGHKTMGGVRASLYVSMPTEGAQRLANFMRDFRLKYNRQKL